MAIITPSTWVNKVTPEMFFPMRQSADSLDALRTACTSASDFLVTAHQLSRLFRESFALLFSKQGLWRVTDAQDELTEMVGRMSVGELSRGSRYILRLDYLRYRPPLDDYRDWQGRLEAATTALSEAVSAPLLNCQYMDPEAAFKAWWRGCLHDVEQWISFAQRPEYFVELSRENVLWEIAKQVPPGKEVMVYAVFDGTWELVCSLESHNMNLAEGGRVWRRVHGATPRVDVLEFGDLSLNEADTTVLDRLE